MTIAAPDVSGEASQSKPVRGSGGAAAIIAGSILASRLFGIVRQSLMATFLGTTAAADAFTAAFKISNILQNLFGEGVLSASFIPVYAPLVVRGDDDEAGRVAGSVASLLVLAVAVFVLIGVLATPSIIPLIAMGFKG